MGASNNILNWLESFGRSARIVFALSVFVFVLLVTEFVASLSIERVIQHERAATMEQLSTIRARLEGEVNSTLHLSRGMISYVATHPDLTWSDFEPMAAEIIAVGRHIRNIALAPDNVIRFIYPLAGNERALGLDYRSNEIQWPAVQRAIDLGNTVVAGPVNLVQGGQGIIARTPIYIQDRTIYAQSKPEYWGLASIVIDSASMFRATGFEKGIGGLSLAIRGKDGEGAEGEMIMGEDKMFTSGKAVTQMVTLPNGTWQLAAMPTAGWGASESPYMVVRMLGGAIAVIFSVLVYWLLSLERRNRDLALHDHLTKLPNRRLMYDRLYQLAALSDRSKFGFTLLYIDLNNFKPINDEFGHHMGDKVLIEIGERLMALTRKSDTVARVGGDEFVVLLPGVTDHKTVDGVLEKLHSGIGRAIKAGDLEFTVHASVGYARFPDDADDVDRLINIADKNMYEDKTANIANLRVVAVDE